MTCCLIRKFLLGGSPYTFLEPQLPDNLVEELAQLYVKLIKFGMEVRGGKVYLGDLEAKDI